MQWIYFAILAFADFIGSLIAAICATAFIQNLTVDDYVIIDEDLDNSEVVTTLFWVTMIVPFFKEGVHALRVCMFACASFGMNCLVSFNLAILTDLWQGEKFGLCKIATVIFSYHCVK